MKLPNKEQINEMNENLNDVFKSIQTHEGKEFASFVHGMVSLKQICTGINMVLQICSNHEENLSEDEKLVLSTILDAAPEIFASTFQKFLMAAKFNEEEGAKILDWSERIDEQLERGAKRVM
jgi:hypothetical protein